MSWLSQLFARKPAPALSIWSGQVITSQDFITRCGWFGATADDSYALIRAAALPEHYKWFRAEMDKLGIGRGEPRFDCDNFAHLYRDFLNLRFYKSQWDGNAPAAQSAAVAAYWFRIYRKTYFGAPIEWASGHAIAVVATDEGVKFVEPQTGEILTLNENEIASRYNVIT